MSEDEQLAMAISASLEMETKATAKTTVKEHKSGPSSSGSKIREDPMLILAREEAAEMERAKKRALDQENKKLMEKALEKAEEKKRLIQERNDEFIRLCVNREYETIRLMIIENKSNIKKDYPIVCKFGDQKLKDLYVRFGAKSNYDDDDEDDD